MKKLIVLFILTGLLATANAQQFIGARSHAGGSLNFDIVTLNANTPGTIQSVKTSPTTQGTTPMPLAGQFSQGYFYVVTQPTTSANTTGSWGLSKLSVKDWTEVSTSTITLTPQFETPIGMVYDYTTNEMYLVTQDLSGAFTGGDVQTKIYTLDLTTGGVTLFLTINDFFQVVACSPSGNWYGITVAGPFGGVAGQFKSINMTDGTTTLISATGITPNFAQSMNFDRPSGRLFWASATGTNRATSTVRLYEINVATGALTNLGDLENRSYIIGLSSPIIATEVAPANGEGDIAITAIPAVIFNSNITAADLSTISISPAVSNVSASIEDNVLTITHDPFAWFETYTVTVPKEAIQYLEYDISWTFQTMPNPVLCNPPSQLNATNITALSATLSWHETGEATLWNLKYGATGFNVETEGILVSNIDVNPYVLQNLNELTTYDFYVQASCGSETSGWSLAHTFSTPTDCDKPITSFPWTEGFENPIFPTDCWQNIDIDETIEPFTGLPNMWRRIEFGEAAVRPHSGNAHVVHNFSIRDEEGWLVTPKFAIPTGDDAYILRFWSYNEDSENYGPVGTLPDAQQFGYNGVWISEGSNDITSGDFVEVWTPWSPSDVRDEWLEDKVNLSDHYAGKNIYIAFVYKGKVGHRWHLDDLSIDTYDYKDIQIRSIDSPLTGGPNLSGDIKITLYNNGSKPLTNIPAILKINGVEVARETIEGPIYSLVHFEYMFDFKADFSTVGTYTIEIEVELEGDQQPANNRMTRSIFATSDENIALFGFSVWSYPEPDDHFIKFNTSTFSSTVTQLGQFSEGNNVTVSGEYLDGYFYIFSQRDDNDISGYFVKIDTETWSEVSRVAVTECAHEMTYDYSTQTMYAAQPTGPSQTRLYTVDMNTGVLTQIATVNSLILGLACDLDGTMYAALNTGAFVKIDKNTGAIQHLYNTGYVYAQYLQSMAFDHNTGRLFWALAGQGPNSGILYGGLVEIDKTTGVPYYYGRIGFIHTLIVGLHTPYTNPDVGVALPKEDVRIVVYPNPVNAGEELNFNLPEGVANAIVSIYNVTGSLIHQQVSSQTIIAPNQAGMYVIEIRLPNGAKSTQKIIVK
ncbi:MAG: T9SS type A sorting domain-containing protein [Bacteroidales bacterium]|nr:T9SS type A sorting domain-containing protein [Bacteroidales bacterium]